MRLGLSQKLTMSMVGIAFTSVAITTYVAEDLVEDLTTPMVQERLSARMAYDRQQLSHYLEALDRDITTWAGLPGTREALSQFQSSWAALGGEQLQLLQRLYIADNPAETGSKDEMKDPGDGSQYSAVHAQIHPSYRRHKDQFGYYDIFLIDTEGNIIYSVYKELDYATNLVSGAYSDSGLGDVFRQAMSTDGSSTSFSDFRAYAPSYGAPASFIARKVVDAQGKPLGVIAFQMPVEKINALLGDRGNGVRAMIVGTDRLLRNQVAALGEDTILKHSINTPAVTAALDGKTGIFQADGDNPFVKAYAPISFNGVTWAFLSEQDRDVAYAAVDTMKRWLLGICAGLLVLALLAGWIISTRTARPIKAMLVDIEHLARGDASYEVSRSQRQDEIGDVQRALCILSGALRQNVMAAQKIADGDLQFEVTLCSSDDALGQALQRMLAKLREVLADAMVTSDDVTSDAGALNLTADSLSDGSSRQSAAAQQAAAAVEQITENIRQSSENATETEGIAAEAADRARSSGVAVSAAVGSMKSIAEKITIVQEIARQTDLLALNAAVEAARAGEHGRGFAVVASEVRKLAERSQVAAEEISLLSSSTVAESETAGKMLKTLVPEIENTASLVQEISTAMREQTIGAGQINDAIHELDKVIQQNAGLAGTASENATSLLARSSKLRQSIGYFDLKEPVARPQELTQIEVQDRAA